MKGLYASVRGLTVLIAIGFLLSAASGEAVKKIKLPSAGGSVRATGVLRGMDDSREFIFHGVRGTNVKLELSGAGPLRGVVTFPSGGHEGGPGGGVLSEPLPETGWYRLRVSESEMGEAWNGSFQVDISVGQ
jgi:hypothetical protein